jgi:hypothetical protein
METGTTSAQTSIAPFLFVLLSLFKSRNVCPFTLQMSAVIIEKEWVLRLLPMA